jgi:hypothetical protein
MARKKRNLAPVSEIVGNITKKFGPGFNATVFKLQSLWIETVGEHVGIHSEPIKLYGKKLVVRVEHSSWMHELSYLKPEMIAKINSILGTCQINDVRFISGTVWKSPSGMRKKTLPAEMTPLTSDEEEFILKAAAEIKDDLVRDAALRAMRRSFTSEKKV